MRFQPRRELNGSLVPLESFLTKHFRPGWVTKHLVERPSLALALTELHFRLVDRSELAVLAGLS